MTTDPRGVLRGKCTACACVQYIVQPGAIKCAQCGHPPGKHVNVAASLSQPAPTYAGAVVNRQVGQTHDRHSPSVSAVTASSSAYGSGYVSAPPPPPSDLPECAAPDCDKEVHYDHELGPFDYCTPECRDRHLLPIERQKLEEAIKEFSKKIADLPPLDPVKVSDHCGKETYKKIVVRKWPKEDLGIVIRKDRVIDGLQVVGVKMKTPAYESVKKGDVEFLDIITELNGEPCTMESEYQESVRSKTQPQLTLKRSGAMPSIKKLLSEVEENHPTATHVLVLQNPQQIGGDYDFGFEPVFIKDQGVMLALNDTPKSSAYQSRVTNDDVIMMYATVNNTKIGGFKPPSSKKRSEGEEMKDFENDIKKAALDGKSMILVLKRLPSD